MRVLGLVVSAGRCATKSIAESLQSISHPKLRVYHERLSVEHTLPCKYFRAYEPSLMREQAGLPAVSELLADLDRTDEEAFYIETGWTLYPLMPMLIERYGGKVRILHLTRHPVLTAASLALHGLYEEGRERELGKEPLPLLLPQSPRVFHPEVARLWHRMSPFERNLFRVTEINLFALELHDRYPKVPWLRLRLEDFDRDTGNMLVGFYGLPRPERDTGIPRSNDTKKLARGARSIGDEWKKVSEHSWAIRAGQRLGYDVSSEGLSGLEDKMRRYRKRGVLEHLVSVTYQIGPARRLWRRVVTPRPHG